MTNWNDFETAAPTLAAHARERFEAHGLAVLATLRKDGSPRVSGIEPLIAEGELWLGMMPGSRKSLDIQRDPRLSLHNATVDKAVTDGDVRVSGRGVRTTDPDDFVAMRAAFEAASGSPPPPGPFDLYKVDLTDVVSIRPAGDHLEIESWTPEGGLRSVDRF